MMIFDRYGDGRETIFKDADWKAVLFEYLCQTQEELAETLWTTQPEIFNRLKATNIIQKQANRNMMDPRWIERRFLACEELLQNQSRCIYTLKKELITTIPNAESHIILSRSSTEYSQFKGPALYLTGPSRRSIR